MRTEMTSESHPTNDCFRPWEMVTCMVLAGVRSDREMERE